MYALDCFRFCRLPLRFFFRFIASAIARMPKFRRFSNGDLVLNYKKEANEVFKRNSEQQDQVISILPEEVGLNNL